VAARIEPYVPIPVREKLRSGIGDKWLAELRRSTAIFINLKGLALNYSGCNDPIVIRRVDNALRKMQQIIQQNQGYLRQFCVDDKGTVLIVVFGVPPFTWENNAVRAVKTAMEVKDMLNGIHIQHGIGIATGDVYVGSVGSHVRHEHAVVGDTVNTAARLSNKVPANSIWVEENTHALAKTTIQFRWVKELKVKGKNKLIQVYHPEGLSRNSALSTHKQLLGRQKELKEFSIAVFKLKEFLKKNSLQGPQKPSSRLKSRTRTSMGIGSINARMKRREYLRKSQSVSMQPGSRVDRRFKPSKVDDAKSCINEEEVGRFGFWISGAPGVGKSALVSKFYGLARVNFDPYFQYARTRCCSRYGHAYAVDFRLFRCQHQSGNDTAITQTQWNLWSRVSSLSQSWKEFGIFLWQRSSYF